MVKRRRLRAAAAAFLVLLSAAPAMAAIIINNAIRQEIRIQLGYADENGQVTWSPTTIPACRAVELQEDPALRMLHPKFLDERLNPDTGTIDYEFVQLVQAGRISIGEVGGRIILDMSGTAECPPE